MASVVGLEARTYGSRRAPATPRAPGTPPSRLMRCCICCDHATAFILTQASLIALRPRYAVAQTLRDGTGPRSGKHRRRCANSRESAHMYTRATFAGPLAPLAAALLLLGCSDVVTSERRAGHPVAAALDAIPIAGHDLYVPSGFNINV